MPHRLRMIAVVASPTQSAGISGTICTPEKAEIKVNVSVDVPTSPSFPHQPALSRYLPCEFCVNKAKLTRRNKPVATMLMLSN